jgi:thioesterase domain-containing protein/aryl carrier-like protein
VAGELHVGGAGLARGYLNRPELTTEKFVSNPFSIAPGARLYRTGDLCRYRADGNIEFLGRLDQQVKVRGYRIELGEIEAALNLHPALRETVVVARANTADEKELVAYLVAHEKLQPTVAELRAFLRKKLPDYMVPVVFVILPTLPRTPNGKIDRKALPTSGKNRLVSDAQFMAPGAPAEMALAAIWQELLGVERVGIHDNFFALGGHSLMVVKMVNEIRRQMNFDLQIWTLFQHPTIFELAKVLPIQKNMERKPELIQLQAGHSGPEFFFLIDEGSLGLLKLSHFLDDDLRLYASVVPISESTLGAATKGQFSALPRMEDWAAKHVALIKSRQTTGPLLLAGHCFGGMLAFEVAQQLQDAGIKVEAVLLLDTWMITPTFWWEKKAWLREHLGKLLKQGPQYLWRKSWRRIKLGKRERASKLEMATHDDFNLHIPWAIIARIYRHAITGYRPKPLSSRGILFVSQDDWLSNAYRPLDDSLGASRLFTGGVEVINVPGNHVTVLSETHLRTLAEHIKKHLKISR